MREAIPPNWLAMVALVGCASVLAGCASTAPAGGVLVVEDESRVRGCRVLGTVADNELDDLQKKAGRVGGNVVLLTPQRKAKGGWFGLQDYMTGDVYLCERGRSREPAPPWGPDVQGRLLERRAGPQAIG